MSSGSGAYIAGVWHSTAVAGALEEPQGRPTDTRFRSFAERYLIERCRLWPAECKPDEMAWETILQAKTIYKMIAEQSRTVK